MSVSEIDLKARAAIVEVRRYYGPVWHYVGAETRVAWIARHIISSAEPNETAQNLQQLLLAAELLVVGDAA